MSTGQYTLTKRNELKTFLTNSNHTIVKISATWCKPCIRAKPTFDMYYEKIKDYVNLVLVDADEGSDICSSLKVRSVPIYIYYKKSDPIDICNSSGEDDIKAFFIKVAQNL